jgi:hypothetical protein
MVGDKDLCRSVDALEFQAKLFFSCFQTDFLTDRFQTLPPLGLWSTGWQAQMEWL